MSKDESSSPSARIKSVGTSLQIIDELKRQDGATVTELATTINVSKATVHKHLSTLREQGYVVNNNGTYQIGLRFLDIGGYALLQFDGINEVKPKVRELAEETGETVQFSTEQCGRAVVLSRVAGNKGVFSRTRLGKRFYMHQTAGGKAILAHLPEKRVQQIIDRHGLPAATDSTITTKSELFEALETIRDRGYSLNKAETTEGLHAVGVPLIGRKENVLGAFVIIGPSYRISDEKFKDEIPNTLQSAVKEIELNLRYS